MRALAFFNGGRNTDGRTLDQILAWNDDDLEGYHDVIQWCFPLHEPSGVNADAPVVTEEEQRVLSGSPEVRKKMREVIERWLGFYGFAFEGGKVAKSEGFEEKSRRWNWTINHNHLRITRIIRSLRLFGLEDEAREVYEVFAGFARSESSKIGERSTVYWEEALRGGLFAPIRGRRPSSNNG